MNDVARGPAAVGVEAPIAAVTVYNDRARVSRRSKLTIPAGRSIIQVGGLTGGLDDASIRAKLTNADGVEITGVSAEWEGHASPPREAEAKLVEEIERIQREITQLNDELSILGVRQGLAQQYQDHARRSVSRAASSSAATTSSSWKESLAYLGEERDANAAKQRDLYDQLEKLNDELSARSSELARLRAPSSRRTRRVEITVESATEVAEALIAVDYVVYDARWSSAYDVRADGAELELTYFGTVTQGTGEDWDNVSLVLSTARPSQSAQIPKLTPVQLSGYKREKRPVQIVSYGTERDKSDDRKGEAPPPPAPKPQPHTATVAPDGDDGRAQLGDSGDAITFVIKGSESIPADRRPHKVEITSDRLPAKVGFETIPKVAPWVYQKATAKNEGSFPILPGPVNVFRKSVFVGAGSLEYVAVGEEFSVSLGSDERIKVRRIIDERVSSKPKILGSKRTINYAYRIELKNFCPDEQTITVVDNIPVSEREELEVTLADNTKPTSQDDQGFVKWEVTLAAGETKTVPFGYEVSYPKDWTIHGL